jgi:hypothetical protein
MKQLVLQILWPAFMTAGVLETMVFAVIDPADLHRHLPHLLGGDIDGERHDCAAVGRIGRVELAAGATLTSWDPVRWTHP